MFWFEKCDKVEYKRNFWYWVSLGYVKVFNRERRLNIYHNNALRILERSNKRLVVENERLIEENQRLRTKYEA